MHFVAARNSYNCMWKRKSYSDIRSSPQRVPPAMYQWTTCSQNLRNIESTYIQAKKHYRVVKSAGSEATQNISALIKQGKKKKRNVKFNTSEREYLNRNVNAARSFRSKSSYGAGFVHPLREAFFTNSQQVICTL
ncbi:hypothetical protein OSTOST_16562 [Ostertagia ostertagi]